MICQICRNGPKVIRKTNKFYYFLRFYRTHYDVLNLPKNCSAKDIKNAFIRLSKEHHPDINKNEQSHVKFQKINEAYKVLGKPESRRDYDLGLIQPERQHVRQHHTETYYEQAVGRNPHHDPRFWANRDRSQDKYYENRPYYGINGVPRLSNGTIMVCCLFFAFIGVGIQFIAISQSTTFKREALIRKSLEAEKELRTARNAATVNGNAVQLEALKVKLLGDAVKETDDK